MASCSPTAPGDPRRTPIRSSRSKKLLGKVPLFGICLGHQLTALAVGGSTYKLKYGHRGVNQPVRDLNGVRTYITSQNHGYAVDGGSVKVGKVRFVNANDGTCEGIDYPRPAGLYGPVPPGGLHRPQGHGVSV